MIAAHHGGESRWSSVAKKMIHLRVDEQSSIVLWDTAIGRQKRYGPLWKHPVGFSGRYLCEGAW